MKTCLLIKWPLRCHSYFNSLSHVIQCFNLASLWLCIFRYPNLTQKLSRKLQNKCIRFCLQLVNRSHIGANEFQQINWLPINERFSLCVASPQFLLHCNLEIGLKADVVFNQIKLADRSRWRPEGSLFVSFYQLVGEGATPFPCVSTIWPQ